MLRLLLEEEDVERVPLVEAGLRRRRSAHARPRWNGSSSASTANCTTNTGRRKPRSTSPLWKCRLRLPAGDHSHRPADRQRPAVCPRRRAEPGSDRRAGRAVHRRRGRRTRIPQPPGTERRAVPPRSLQRRGGGHDVPNGRPLPLAARREHRVPGPARRPGEDPRRPAGTGRSRGRHQPPSGGGAGRSGRCGSHPRITSTWPPTWCRAGRPADSEAPRTEFIKDLRRFLKSWRRST